MEAEPGFELGIVIWAVDTPTRSLTARPNSHPQKKREYSTVSVFAKEILEDKIAKVS